MRRLIGGVQLWVWLAVGFAIVAIVAIPIMRSNADRAWSAEAWTAIAAWTTTIIATLAAAFAFRQVREAQRLRVDTSRPYVIVDIEGHDGVVVLVIENIGASPAHDLRITFEPDLTEQDDNAMVAILQQLAGEGISFLAPRRRLSFFYAVPRDDDWLSRVVLRTRATLQYRSSSASEPFEPETVYINVEAIKHSALGHSVEGRLLEVQQSINKLTAAVNQVHKALQPPAT